MHKPNPDPLLVIFTDINLRLDGYLHQQLTITKCGPENQRERGA
jgi:hypothetical protein